MVFERPSRERRLRGHRWSKRTRSARSSPWLGRDQLGRREIGKETAVTRHSSFSRQRGSPHEASVTDLHGQNRAAGRGVKASRTAVSWPEGSTIRGSCSRIGWTWQTLTSDAPPSWPSRDSPRGTAGRGARDRMNDRGRCKTVSVKAEDAVQEEGAEAEARWQSRDEVAGDRGSWP